MGAVNANIIVTCVAAAANTYSIGGTVSGLAQNESITLTLSPTGGVYRDRKTSLATLMRLLMTPFLLTQH